MNPSAHRVATTAALPLVIGPAHRPRMNNSDRILSIVNMADKGGGLNAGEAVRVIADLIDRLDPSCEGYAQEVEALLRIGATVWRQQQQQQRGPRCARKTRPASP